MLTRFTSTVTGLAGSAPALIGATFLVAVWALTGPVFQFSEAWQLAINSPTTVITFLMVFVIQSSSNRDNRSVQTKLDAILEELGLDPDLVGLEDLPERAIKVKQQQVRDNT